MSYKNQTNQLLKQFQDAVTTNSDFDTLILSLDTVFNSLLTKAYKTKNEACVIIDAIMSYESINDQFVFVPSSVLYIDLFHQKCKQYLYKICEDKLDQINPEIEKLELDPDHHWFKDLDDFFVSSELNSLYNIKNQVELLQESINYA
jgi:hypothetical protein